MHLIAKNGARIKVESHAVCSHSTLLGARIIEGAIVIKVDHEERVVQQMVDWMHRTGGENHLTGGLSLDQIAAIGPSEVSTKLLALVDVGKIAIEVLLMRNTIAKTTLTAHIVRGLQAQRRSRRADETVGLEAHFRQRCSCSHLQAITKERANTTTASTDLSRPKLQ